MDKPKIVFFFDEAHLLFTDAPKALLERIELVVRLVRSKGVGVYFVTQNALDVLILVLAQLGNRVQHALRAFTPRDQKAVKSAAETMRQNPKFSIETAITELAVGEALVSFLDEKGRPGVTERVYVLPPCSQIGPITAQQRKTLIANSIVTGVYEKAADRESAFEAIRGRHPGAHGRRGHCEGGCGQDVQNRGQRTTSRSWWRHSGQLAVARRRRTAHPGQRGRANVQKCCQCHRARGGPPGDSRAGGIFGGRK